MEGYTSDIIGYIQDIKALNNEIAQLKEDLVKAPDLVEFVQLRARFEGLQEIIREKDRSIERLENDIKKADTDKEDLKNTYNNYFVQIQLLIQQQAIGNPKEAKVSKKEETSTAEKVTTPQKGENDLIEKICKNCNQVFYTGNIKKETCSSKCRSAFNRKTKNAHS